MFPVAKDHPVRLFQLTIGGSSCYTLMMPLVEVTGAQVPRAQPYDK